MSATEPADLVQIFVLAGVTRGVENDWRGALDLTDPARIGPLLDLLVDNPWGRLTQMHPESDRDAPPRPYLRATAIEATRYIEHRGRRCGSVELAAETGGVFGQIRSHTGIAAQTFVGGTRFRAAPHSEAAARALLERMLDLLPPGAIGMVDNTAIAEGFPGFPEYLARAGLTKLPKPFGDGFPWLIAIPPRIYRTYYDREALLATPAVRVDEDAAGRIWIQLYDHALDYDTPAAYAALRAIHAYLTPRARDQWIPV